MHSLLRCAEWRDGRRRFRIYKKSKHLNSCCCSFRFFLIGDFSPVQRHPFTMFHWFLSTSSAPSVHTINFRPTSGGSSAPAARSQGWQILKGCEGWKFLLQCYETVCVCNGSGERFRPHPHAAGCCCPPACLFSSSSPASSSSSRSCVKRKSFEWKASDNRKSGKIPFYIFCVLFLWFFHHHRHRHGFEG